MTDFLAFTKDPDEDITNTPAHYHDFHGAAVRIRVYWTAPIWSDWHLLTHSHRLIHFTADVLKKYSLSLDTVPSGGSGPVVHAEMRKRATNALKSELGKDDYGTLADMPVVGSFASSMLDAFIDQISDASRGLINFNGLVNVPDEALPAIDDFKTLRASLDPVAEENRLVVVFVPMSGADGCVVRFADWLPWVVVDPRTLSENATLAHEIGHACRLAHQQVDTIATDKPKKRLNLMSYTPGRSLLWGWQVDTIYDSYWCNGNRPKNWWERSILPVDHPFLWEEKP